jgi:hypothetical protein
MDYLLVAGIVAMITVPISYSVGSIMALVKIRDMETAYLRLSFGVRLFLTHTQPPKEWRDAFTSDDELQSLTDVLSECDNIAGFAIESSRSSTAAPVQDCVNRQPFT